jgi:primosomal protein N' (replication factor Y)
MFGEKISSPSSFVDVAIPVPIAGTSVLSYRAAAKFSLRLVPGVRVVVPVGKRKITGIFIRWSDGVPAAAPEKIKEILDILDEVPVFSQDLVRLWQWATRYYLTSPGEMLSAMLPGGTLSESEIIVQVKRERAKKKSQLSKLTYDDGDTTAVTARAAALQKLTPSEHALFMYIQQRKRVTTKALRRQFPTLLIDEVVRKLEDGQLVESREHLRKRKEAAPETLLELEPDAEAWNPDAVRLSTTQEQACGRVTAALRAGEFQVFLLHGVTGSGKTEVYLRAASVAVEKRQGVLLLVPEIALTHQLVERVRQRFTQGVAVLHSSQTAHERWAEWRRIARGEAKIVIGARSAVFAPIENLGLIVVDEEHDTAYKQEEGTRYNARDLAVVRGQLSSCPVVLGSATPSLESYAHCQTRRYTLLELPERITARPLPPVEVVDLRQRPRRTEEPDRIFSPVLRQALIDNYQARKQSLLFLNRRGYSSYLQCRSCGEALSCTQCSVTLTFHLQGRELRCHYCGSTRKAPDYCPHCREPELEGSGIGTEQVEEALVRLLPEVRVARLDRDSVRKKGFLGRVIESWRAHETDVLIGTQMVTKGHDVAGVTLVGVLLADVALNLPDFRAAERTFQLLTQVAGRAGRGEEIGKVIVQTYSPQHYSVRCAAQHDFRRFATLELRYRKKLGYPPFSRMVNIRFEGREGERVRQTAERFVAYLTSHSPQEEKRPTSLGPAPAPIERIKGRERWQVLLKGEDRLLLHDIVRKAQEECLSRGRSSQVRIIVDVDPYNML